jgi:hypothetical protein
VNGGGPTNVYMNGYAQGNERRDNGSRDLRGQAPEASGRTILEGYRQDILTGFEPEKPRYNPVSLWTSQRKEIFRN